MDTIFIVKNADQVHFKKCLLKTQKGLGKVDVNTKETTEIKLKYGENNGKKTTEKSIENNKEDKEKK